MPSSEELKLETIRLDWAAEARDLDDLSGGRIILGLGNGTAAMMENWHGVSGQAPAARLEELVPLLRQLWRLDQGPVHHDGRFYRVHVVPTDDVPPPLRPHLPIWTAGVNPAMIRAAARVADGLVGHPMFTEQYVAEVVRPELDAATARAGRGRDDVALTGILMCAVNEDEDAARRQLAYAIAQYAASRVYERLYSSPVQTAVNPAASASAARAAARRNRSGPRPVAAKTVSPYTKRSSFGAPEPVS